MPKVPEEKKKQNRYKAIIEKIFFDSYRKSATKIEFDRDDLPRAAKALGVQLPDNLGDVIYSIRYRTPMPEKVLATQPKGMEWIIEGMGRSRPGAPVLNKSQRDIQVPLALSDRRACSASQSAAALRLGNATMAYAARGAATAGSSPRCFAPSVAHRMFLSLSRLIGSFRMPN